MGERHAQWELKLTICQHCAGYKFVLSDDEDDTYIATNYVTASTANELEELINNVLTHSERMESIDDVLNELQKRTYGSMFYSRLKIAPQLTDGVILLAQN
jgi:hypothetical protein